VSFVHTARLALRSAVRHPRMAWRRVSGQKLKAAVRLVAALPPGMRRLLGAWLDRLGAALGQGRRDHPMGAPLRVLGTWARGKRADAAELAERIGTDPATPRRTALRLARTALAIDAVAPAARILEALTTADDADDRTTLALRADIALRTGRYAAALDLGRRALAVDGGQRRRGGRDAGLRAILERAESERRVLEPGWHPKLAPRRGPRMAPARGRILHLLTNSLPWRQAGYTVRAQSIGRAQLDVGLDPHLATRAGFPLNQGVLGVPREERIDGVAYHRLAPGLDPGFGPDRTVTETARAAVELVERLRPALLHPASNFLNAEAAFALRDRFGLPVVYEVRGFLEETWVSRQPAGGDGARQAAEADRYAGARAAETAAMLAADAVVTLSETMRADIVGRGIAADRIVVVPNAVDIERFTPVPRDEALAGQLGIRSDEVVLGYISSFTSYEGIRYLIEAGAILRDRGREVRVLLVGDGEERPALEAEARRLGVADGTVIFAGRMPHDRIRGAYSLIDVFVVPRTADRVSQLVTPLKPYEAMALERAVVVSGVDALLEIVADGETGLTFPPEDAVALADVVEPLLDDVERRARLGAAAREWVAEHRTWRRNGERYRALYERLDAV